MGSSQSTAIQTISVAHVSKSVVKRQKDKDDEVRRKIDEIDYRDYEYPFENFVFKGGGAKGLVYIGCLEVSYYITMF